MAEVIVDENKENFPSYEITLDFLHNKLPELSGKVNLSVTELKKIVYEDDSFYCVCGGQVVNNPNYLVSGYKYGENFALALVNTKNNALYFLSLVSPAFVLEYYGYVGEKGFSESASFLGRIENIRKISNTNNAELFHKIGDKVNEGEVTHPEHAAYSLLADNSSIGAKLSNNYRRDVRTIIQQAILNHVLTHDLRQLKPAIIHPDFDKGLKHRVVKMKRLATKKAHFDFFEYLESLDDITLVNAFACFQTAVDVKQVFPDFEEDILKEGLEALLQHNERTC